MTQCNSVFQEMIKIEIKIELTHTKKEAPLRPGLLCMQWAAFGTFAASWAELLLLKLYCLALLWLSHPKPRVPTKKMHSLRLINSLIVYMNLISLAVGRLPPGRRSRRTLQPCALPPPRHTHSLSFLHTQLPSTCTRSGGK